MIMWSADNTQERTNVPPNLLQQLTTLAKYKTRSHQTCHETHLPILKDAKSLSVVLLGDSMVERFLTSGSTTEVAKLPSCFNAGCGGDKISNVVYRVLIMLPYLPSDVKVWVLMIGTNDLAKKRAVKDADAETYIVLVKALLKVAPGSRVIVCGVFERNDVLNECVEVANGKLRSMIGALNGDEVGNRVSWLEPPKIVKEKHLDDHVHLNEEGYGIWDEVLMGRIREMLGKERKVE